MARTIFTGSFWSDASERALSAGATSALGIFTLGAFKLIADVPWYGVLSAFGLGALYDVLRSLSVARAGNVGTAGATPAIAPAAPTTTAV